MDVQSPTFIRTGQVMQKKAQQRFILIESLLIAAIVGILAASALLAYQAYTARAKMSEVRMEPAPTGVRLPKSTKPATNSFNQTATAGDAARQRRSPSAMR